jgi:hypothetical protein
VAGREDSIEARMGESGKVANTAKVAEVGGTSNGGVVSGGNTIYKRTSSRYRSARVGEM